jgi:hypothetical protein
MQSERDTAMTTESNESNPYCSPQTPGVSNQPIQHNFPWRIVPVILFSLYGGIVVLNSVIFTYMVLGGCSVSVNRTHSASQAQTGVILAAAILMGIHGCCAIAVGRYIWKQRWQRSFIAFAGAVLLMILIGVCTLFVDQLPSGRQRLMPNPASEPGSKNGITKY